jgi:hypothetical protein
MTRAEKRAAIERLYREGLSRSDRAIASVFPIVAIVGKFTLRKFPGLYSAHSCGSHGPSR